MTLDLYYNFIVMSKMETAQKIWEASTKVFDKMDSEKKKEWMNSLIDELETNKWIKWLKESWNTMNEEQKLKIYKRHSISLWSYLKYTFMPYRMWEKVYNITKHSLSKWDNHTRKYATLEEIPCRFFVQLWILDKPKDLENKKLKEDIKKDAKNINLYLWLCEWVCLLTPETEALVPLIQVAKHYTKRYKKEWADAVIERLEGKKLSKIKWDTNTKLLKDMKADNTHKDEKKKKKAA